VRRASGTGAIKRPCGHVINRFGGAPLHDESRNREVKVHLMAFSFLAKIAGTASRSVSASALAASFFMTGGMARGDDTPVANNGLLRHKIEISGSATRIANTDLSPGVARLEPAMRVAPGMAKAGSFPPEGDTAMATRPNDRGFAPGPSAIASSTAINGSTSAAFANAGSNTMARSTPMGGGASQTAAIAIAPAAGVTALSAHTGQTQQRTNANSHLRK
jgi:hypothetical protein